MRDLIERLEAASGLDEIFGFGDKKKAKKKMLAKKGKRRVPTAAQSKRADSAHEKKSDVGRKEVGGGCGPGYKMVFGKCRKVAV